jgi:hypothetical protein
MKRQVFALIFSSILLISCKVTFTKALKDEYISSNFDLKRIQFYNKYPILLEREIKNKDSEIFEGKVKVVNGIRIEYIEIESKTPAVIDSLDNGGVYVRFEENGNNFYFKENKNENCYSLDFSNPVQSNFYIAGIPLTQVTYKGDIKYGEKKFICYSPIPNHLLISKQYKVKKTVSTTKLKGVKVR